MHVDSLVCVRVKGCESECFRVGSHVSHRRIMSTCLFTVYMDAMMKEVKMGMVKRRKSGDCLTSYIQMT